MTEIVVFFYENPENSSKLFQYGFAQNILDISNGSICEWNFYLEHTRKFVDFSRDGKKDKKVNLRRKTFRRDHFMCQKIIVTVYNINLSHWERKWFIQKN